MDNLLCGLLKIGRSCHKSIYFLKGNPRESHIFAIYVREVVFYVAFKLALRSAMESKARLYLLKTQRRNKKSNFIGLKFTTLSKFQKNKAKTHVKKTIFKKKYCFLFI